YAGQGRVGIDATSIELAPAYDAERTIATRLTPGRHVVRIEFSFDDDSRALIRPAGPYATFRLRTVGAEGQPGPPLRAAAPRAWLRAAALAVDAIGSGLSVLLDPRESVARRRRAHLLHAAAVSLHPLCGASCVWRRRSVDQRARRNGALLDDPLGGFVVDRDEAHRSRAVHARRHRRGIDAGAGWIDGGRADDRVQPLGARHLDRHRRRVRAARQLAAAAMGSRSGVDRRGADHAPESGARPAGDRRRLPRPGAP